MIIRNPISSLRVSSSTRARRTICLRSADCENGRISGPFGSPGRERTTPLLSSTRSASRTVDRLTANWRDQFPFARQPLARGQVAAGEGVLDLFDDPFVRAHGLYRTELHPIWSSSHPAHPLVA